MPAHHTTPTWVRIILSLACAGAISAAILVVGPSDAAQTTTERVVSAEKGVVQSTVSGSGNLAPATQTSLNFKASGTLTSLGVTAGQHVYQGQLLASIDPSTALASVQQAQANLDSAQAKLAQVRGNPSGSSSSATSGANAGSGASASSTAATATSATAHASTAATNATVGGPSAFVAAARPPAKSGSGAAPSTGAKTTGTRSSGASAGGASGGAGASPSAGTTASTNAASPVQTTVSPAQQAANLASAQASVVSAELARQSAQQELAATKLYAPVDGTVASVSSVSVGETVSAGVSGSSAAGSSSSTSGAGTGAGGGGAGAGGTSGGGGSSAVSGAATGAGSSSNPTAFVVIVNMNTLDLVVPFSESDISKLAVGQPATVMVNALPNLELAAHVTSLATLSTTNSGVVSYNVTFTLGQSDPRLRPGMTASAQVVTSSATGAVSVPSGAISRSAGQATVSVRRNAKDVLTPVVTGIVGDSTTQVISGLSPGEQVVIRSATNLGGGRTASATPGAGLGGGGLGGGGLGGGGFGGAGGPGAFARGGG